MIMSNVGNVIYVNFAGGARLSDREQYLHMLATELDEFDFQDIVEAVNDTTGAVYLDMDEEMKLLVDLFFQQAI